MFLQYILEMMKLAKFEKLEDGTYYGCIPKFKGIWANESTKRECEKVLREVAEEWILLKVSQKNIPPAIHGKRLIVPTLARA